MRADPKKQEKFARLAADPYFAQVVSANQAYLRAAVPHPAATERDHWALSCLPGTNGGRRFSTVNMMRMEVFVLFRHEEPEDDTAVHGFVVVRESVLRRYAHSGQGIEELNPNLTFDRSRPYQDAGDDQVRIWGWYDQLIAALAEEPFAVAARELAASLLTGVTNNARHHNYQLADQVLGRAVLPLQAG
ncbi:hypothetical protein GA0070616_3734 [Micromonospora nigra]|uniref:Uncharacterized protein n=2 Tax=Micromonospora nigra TaxID=145857 RepID=A0A1C6SH06_9ACTN|nr:hypothetical protein GA0070616_3734 [Micromonospora nigra]